MVSNKIESLDNSDWSSMMEFPEVLLRMVEYQSELKEMELALYEDLLSTFLEILTYQGRIATIPRINYLSDDLNVY